MQEDWRGSGRGEGRDRPGWFRSRQGHGKGKGTGKAPGKGKGEGKDKEKLMVGMFMPPFNSHLIFSSYEHRFYDDFPMGKQISAFDAGINFHLPIEVLETRVGAYTRIDKWGVASECIYVAVKFETRRNREFIWTTFSRGGVAMLNFLVE